jgi:hypothetical protein
MLSGRSEILGTNDLRSQHLIIVSMDQRNRRTGDMSCFEVSFMVFKMCTVAPKDAMARSVCPAFKKTTEKPKAREGIK